MQYVKIIFANIYTISVLAFLSFVHPISAQPNQDQIASAISAHLPAFARLGKFEYRIFESSQPGVGRVSVSGIFNYDQDIIRRTQEPLFAPREMSEGIRNIIFQKANINPESTGWRTVLQAGQNVEINGNLFYEEGVRDFSWEYQLSLSVPEGIVASQLPKGNYIIGGDEHSRLLERINISIKEVQDLQRDFVRYVEREILGRTFSSQNECRGYTSFNIQIHRSPKSLEVRNLTGPGNFFGSDDRLDWRGLAEVVVWGDYDFSVSNGPYGAPFWASEAGGRIGFSFNIKFEKDGQVSFELDRKVAWEANGVVVTNTNSNFIGHWFAGSDFVGFRNGPNESCANPVLVRIE